MNLAIEREICKAPRYRLKTYMYIKIMNVIKVNKERKCVYRHRQTALYKHR